MSQPRFIKIGTQGQQLPADAPAWVAVLDTTTGLMWSVETKRVPRWNKAESAAKEIAAAGFNDWRLSSRNELITLTDLTRVNPAIDTDFFPGCPSDWFWTSDVDAESPDGYAWSVFFSGGFSSRGSRYGSGFVRAVRVGQSLAVGPLTEQGAA